MFIAGEAVIRVLTLSKCNRGKRKGGEAWKLSYEQLKEFKQIKGHCKLLRAKCLCLCSSQLTAICFHSTVGNVPTKYKDNKPLGRWVSTQRQQYKAYMEGRSVPAGAEEFERRIKMLEEIGFIWSLALGPPEPVVSKPPEIEAALPALKLSSCLPEKAAQSLQGMVTANMPVEEAASPSAKVAASLDKNVAQASTPEKEIASTPKNAISAVCV